MSNPLVYAVDHPYAALGVFGWLCLGIALLTLTTYALGRNLLTLYHRYDSEGWTLPPFEWMLRFAGVWVLLAFDAWVLGVLGYLLT